MGNFYTSYTLKGPDQQTVAAALAGRSAIVAPARDGCVVVFDEESDNQNQGVIAGLASRLSRQLHCPLLAVLNHDDDILWFQLHLDGALLDEYDSTPGYFDESEDESENDGTDPVGGDARKLCDAFGVDEFFEVEYILRRPVMGNDSYVFAFERHADLAAALGIPSFCACGFEQISNGELPEGLEDHELVQTKDLAPPASDARAEDASGAEVVPGYYKLSSHAHPSLTDSIPIGWMPALWVDLECSEQVLSAEFQRAAAGMREKMGRLGFIECGFKMIRRALNPNLRDSGGINYLDGGRCHHGQLIYIRSFLPALGSDQENVVVAFTAMVQNGAFTCTNDCSPLSSDVPNHQVIRVRSDDVAFVYDQFIEHLKQRNEPPRAFPDLPSLRAWSDANAMAALDHKVRRGILIRMNDDEVSIALRLMPPPVAS